MIRKITVALSIILVLTACVKVSVETPASDAPVKFMTSTLPPTKQGPALPTSVPPTKAVTVSANSTVPTSSPDCKDSALLIADVTYPDNTRLEAGEKFTKTWRLQNTGTCNWNGYTATFLSGDKMDAPDSVPVPQTAAKTSVDLSVELVAPANDGAFTGVFELRNAAGEVVPIGTERSFWVKILVGDVPVQASGSGSGTSGLASYFPQCSYSESAVYVQQLMDLINQARAEAGLSAVTIQAQLAAAAQAHSMDMACGNYLSHNGPNGEFIGYRIRESGYASAGFSEIIAIGTPQDAMYQWRNDPGHWEIVMNPNLQWIGVGYAYSASSAYGGYMTVDFG